MFSSKNFFLITLCSIILFINGCSSNIYKNFNQPILIENNFKVNDSLIKKDPIKFLIQPNDPTRKLFGYPLGLAIYNLSNENPDEKFDYWINKRPKRLQRLNKILSEKQTIQLKNYNRLFNNFLKNLGEEPKKVSEVNVNENILRLKQYYDNEGYFDSEVNVDTIISDNQAVLNYYVKTNRRYIIDSVSLNIKSNDIDSLTKLKIDDSYLKENEYFSIGKLILERDRLFNLFRNNGIYNFQRRDIKYDVLIDSTGLKKTIPIILNISDTDSDNNYRIRKINKINIFVESLNELSNIDTYTDSINYRGIDIYSKGSLNYSPKSLLEPIFFKKGEEYSEEKKLQTSRYFSNIGAFKYPRIILEELRDSISTSIYLLPRDGFSLGFDLDFTHSNIEDFGISFGTNFNIRNIFRGTENLSLNLNNSIGASKDIGNIDDSFFNLFELGGNLSLRIPRIFLPLKTESFIKKNMSPETNITVGSTVQRNIGLDKQYYSGIYQINWNPSRYNKINIRLIDFEYVNNQNISNYFNVYKNSYDKLNYISSLYNLDQSTLDQNGDLTIPLGADKFITNVLSNQTSLDYESEFYRDINSITERKTRLTQNNIIIGSSFTINRNTQENFLDENFSQIRFKFETVGNLFNEILRKNNLNSNNKVEISDIIPSQYIKAEINYIKHLKLNNSDVLALRAFAGSAIPFGNSDYIPFTRSYYAGGSNDNRAWKAYKLGPGSSDNINEFNEANFKIAFNIEYRNNISGNLNGALFIDIGNIWNLNDNVTDNSMTFDKLSDLSELAIGTGFGLRYDFNFFVLRLDTGFKTYNPANNISRRWFKDFSFKKAVFNIGINYPF